MGPKRILKSLSKGGMDAGSGAPWRLINDRLRVAILLADSKSDRSLRGLFDGTVNWIRVANGLRWRYLEILERFRPH